jgi:hypothetical protein
VVIVRSPEIPESGATGIVIVVFDVLRVVLCDTTAGAIIGAGGTTILFNMLRVILDGDRSEGGMVWALISRVDAACVD